MRSRWAIRSASFRQEEEETDVRRDKEESIDRDPDKRVRLSSGTEELIVIVSSPRNAAKITQPNRPHRRDLLWWTGVWKAACGGGRGRLWWCRLYREVWSLYTGWRGDRPHCPWVPKMTDDQVGSTWFSNVGVLGWLTLSPIMESYEEYEEEGETGGKLRF